MTEIDHVVAKHGDYHVIRYSTGISIYGRHLVTIGEVKPQPHIPLPHVITLANDDCYIRLEPFASKPVDDLEIALSMLPEEIWSP